jgi:hypothetical protein
MCCHRGAIHVGKALIEADVAKISVKEAQAHGSRVCALKGLDASESFAATICDKITIRGTNCELLRAQELLQESASIEAHSCKHSQASRKHSNLLARASLSSPTVEAEVQRFSSARS